MIPTLKSRGKPADNLLINCSSLALETARGNISPLSSFNNFDTFLTIQNYESIDKHMLNIKILLNTFLIQ